jgi:hypothetical protein
MHLGQIIILNGAHHRGLTASEASRKLQLTKKFLVKVAIGSFDILEAFTLLFPKADS